MKLISIGFGNMISSEKLVAIVSPESAPIKRVIQEAKVVPGGEEQVEKKGLKLVYVGGSVFLLR